MNQHGETAAMRKKRQAHEHGDEVLQFTSDIGRFGIVPGWIFTLGLSARAIALYAALSVAWNRHDVDEHPPSHTTLAHVIGMNVKEMRGALDELEQHGAIEACAGYYLIHHERTSRADTH